MATREQITQMVDVLAAVVKSMPVVHVPLDDLHLWAEQLDADEMTLALRHDGRVRATVTKYFSETGLLIVDAVADVAVDLELPACPEGEGFGESVRLPIDDVWRLRSFAVKAEVA